MARHSHLLVLLCALLSLISIVHAASPTSFCKCTCFSNSTIIPLNGESNKSKDHHGRDVFAPRDTKKSGDCNDCNKKFCLSYNLPVCKGAKEDDVLTTCFQRDSTKDQAVVYIFIFATVGLLAYAAIRPWVEKWRENARQRRSYIPVSNQGDQ